MSIDTDACVGHSAPEGTQRENPETGKVLSDTGNEGQGVDLPSGIAGVHIETDTAEVAAAGSVRGILKIRSVRRRTGRMDFFLYRVDHTMYKADKG